MRKIVITMLFAVLAFSAYATTDPEAYDVVEIYERVDVPSGTKASDGYSVEEIEYIYVPTTIDIGRYSIEVSKEDSNFYRVCGTDLYIETRYCYEYASYTDAILVVESNYGYDQGDLIFLD